MKQSLKVSVIIPVYSTEKYLGECLDSVLGQSLHEIEIICVDDGSTDKSPNILAKYAQQDSRLKILKQKNSGPALARNRAMRVARGEFLAFMDGDDYYPSSGILEKLYSTAKKQKVKICGGSFSDFNTSSGVVTTSWADPLLDGYTFSKAEKIKYTDYQFDYGWTRFIYNRELLIRNRIFQPNYKFFEDPPFFVEAMITAGEFYAIPDVTYCYRSSHKSLNFYKDSVQDALEGMSDNLQIAKADNLDKLYTTTLGRINWLLDFAYRNELGFLKRINSDLQNQIDCLTKKADEAEKTIRERDNELMGLRQSRSFRLGIAITQPLRILKKLLNKNG